MKVSAIVTLKKEVLDPQGKVVKQTLKNMGYENIINVRQGKFFEHYFFFRFTACGLPNLTSLMLASSWIIPSLLATSW